MSLAESYHDAHRARLAKIEIIAANRPGRSKLKATRPEDPEYEAAWSLAIMGGDEYFGTVPKVLDIQRAVCRHYGVTLTNLLSESKSGPLVKVRQIAMYLSKRLTTRSLSAISRDFKRDHTTAIHAVNKITKAIQTDLRLSEEVQLLIRKLGCEYAK